MQIQNHPSFQEDITSDKNNLANDNAKRTLSALQEITKIKYPFYLCFQHPEHQLLELPPQVIERCQKMPLEFQHHYAATMLRNIIYSIFYNGSMRNNGNRDASNNVEQINLDNNTFLGVNLFFFEQLHKNNCGKGYFDRGWLITKEETDGSLAVKKGELTLHIERHLHLQNTEKSLNIGDSVAILMPKNLVQNGFYVAVSNQGIQSQDNTHEFPQTVRVYFHLTSEGAAPVMAAITKQLNEICIPFTFKTLYNPDDYQRYDSGVLYFQKNHYPAVWEILNKVYLQAKKHFKPQIPLFTKFLASGLGLAEEPNQKFNSRESFGINRCQIIANALLSSWHEGANTSSSLFDAILENFSLSNIDWQHAYLNPKSEDIYTPLNL